MDDGRLFFSVKKRESSDVKKGAEGQASLHVAAILERLSKRPVADDRDDLRCRCADGDALSQWPGAQRGSHSGGISRRKSHHRRGLASAIGVSPSIARMRSSPSAISTAAWTNSRSSPPLSRRRKSRRSTGTVGRSRRFRTLCSREFHAASVPSRCHIMLAICVIVPSTADSAAEAECVVGRFSDEIEGCGFVSSLPPPRGIGGTTMNATCSSDRRCVLSVNTCRCLHTRSLRG